MPDSTPAPHSPALDSDRDRLGAAQAFFEKGNYAATRDAAQALLTSSEPDVAKEAQELLNDLAPPPMSRLLLALTFVLLTAVTIFAYQH